MAQINLLKQSGGGYTLGDMLPKILARFLFVVLLVLAGYYAWLFVDLKKAENKIVEVQAQINREKQAAINIGNRDELFIRQTQLKNLEGQINSHVYWSQLLPELARVTLKASKYSSFRVNSSGDVDLNVRVPTLLELDKYMQVFDIADFNANFSDIRVGGFSKVQGETDSSIQFNVRMKYNPELIQYQSPKK